MIPKIDSYAFGHVVVELYNSERGRKRTVAALHLTC